MFCNTSKHLQLLIANLSIYFLKGDKYIHTHSHRFNSHFPGKPGLSISPLTPVPATVFCDVYRQQGEGVKYPQAYIEF